jgi:diadenosine tetraphosphatase ApaH/serine/threonine PP2A family protein phosphatase
MEQVEDVLRRGQDDEGQGDASLNTCCSPSSLSIVEFHSLANDKSCEVAPVVMEHLNTLFRKDPGLLHDFPQVFATWVLQLCTEVTRIVVEEPVFLHLRSPMYILGDIHGNFADIYFYMSRLIPFGNMQYCAAQFLFLGDYVDRGAFGLEVVAYLFAMKVMSPKTVWLLRGNHELFTINGDEQRYGDGSFKTQCLRRFGPKLGDDVWVAVNEVFRFLPLAASIDGKIFCAHGGIPRLHGSEDLRMKMLNDPEFPRFNSTHPQAGDSLHRKWYREIAMDLLWSDPSDDEEGLNEFGFGPNPRGPNTFTFGNKAIEQFLQNSGHEYIVRAHEFKHDGLRIHKSARVLTVFTSSGYCGGNNGAGALFVGQGMLRLMSAMPSPKENFAFTFQPPEPSPATPCTPPRPDNGYHSPWRRSPLHYGGAEDKPAVPLPLHSGAMPQPRVHQHGPHQMYVPAHSPCCSHWVEGGPVRPHSRSGSPGLGPRRTLR